MAGAIQTITLLQLRDLIKKEAKVEGSDNLDSWITDLINELLLNFILQKKYSELLLTNVSIAIVAAQESYALPANFNYMRLVRYQTTSNLGRIKTLLPRNEFVETTVTSGLPRFYEVVGFNIKLLPYLDVLAGDTLLIDYYSYPVKLSDNADVFPIPRLIAPVKQRAIYRTHIYNNSLQQAAALKGDSVETEIRGNPPKG